MSHDRSCIHLPQTPVEENSGWLNRKNRRSGAREREGNGEGKLNNMKGGKEQDQTASSHYILHDPPILLHPKCPILLPLIVKGCEEKEIGAEAGAQTRQRLGLILRARHGDLIASARMRPSGLGNDDLLRATDGIADATNLPLEPGARPGRLDGPVEEGMRIRRAVVGRPAQLRVRDERVEGVDRDDATRVPGLAEDIPRGAEGGDDVGRRRLAHVDELVADADGGDGAAVVEAAVELLDHGAEVPRHVGDGEQAREDSHAVLRGRRDHGRDLIAVHAVDADARVSLQRAKV
jgi:hypothetical protein